MMRIENGEVALRPLRRVEGKRLIWACGSNRCGCQLAFVAETELGHALALRLGLEQRKDGIYARGKRASSRTWGSKERQRLAAQRDNLAKQDVHIDPRWSEEKRAVDNFRHQLILQSFFPKNGLLVRCPSCQLVSCLTCVWDRPILHEVEKVSAELVKIEPRST